MTELIAELQDRLSSRADPKTRRWWESYLRGSANFRGVKMAVVRSELHGWWGAFDLAKILSGSEQAEMALRLIRQPMTEDKLAGILLLQERLIPDGLVSWRAHGPRLAALFDEGHLADWNAVDWCCVKALADLARTDEDAVWGLLSWSDADVLWRARASVVPFVSTVGHPDRYLPGFEERLLEACGKLIRRPERFAKTAVGWVLRDYAGVRQRPAEAFIRTHLGDFSLESLRNATKSMAPNRGRALVAAFKTA